MLVPVRIDGLTVQTGARWIDEVPCGNGGCEFVCGWGGLGWIGVDGIFRVIHLVKKQSASIIILWRWVRWVTFLMYI